MLCLKMFIVQFVSLNHCKKKLVSKAIEHLILLEYNEVSCLSFIIKLNTCLLTKISFDVYDKEPKLWFNLLFSFLFFFWFNGSTKKWKISYTHCICAKYPFKFKMIWKHGSNNIIAWEIIRLWKRLQINLNGKNHPYNFDGTHAS